MTDRESAAPLSPRPLPPPLPAKPHAGHLSLVAGDPTREADRLRDELTDAHGVSVNDRRRTWFTAAKGGSQKNF